MSGWTRAKGAAPTFSEHGLTADSVLRQHDDPDALDASTLLAATFGLQPAGEWLRRWSFRLGAWP